jgi:flavin reductase (DIM6/NTAB) family NADH-FMN oxidoreductase RutF
MKHLKIAGILFVLFSLSCNSQNQINTMEAFEKTNWKALDENVIQMIGHEWMLVAAGNMDDGFNMMTASWGGMGWLWEKPVAFIFVRPQRYTFEFTERETFFTLTFYEAEYRNILAKMGSVSGRDFDKINNSGLTPVITENGSIGFGEARIVVECRKLYSTFLEEDEFHDSSVSDKMYPSKDFHKMYIGEIINVWIKK